MATKKRNRRAWGSGSITERRPGVWRITISAGADPWSGKRRQVARTVHGSKSDAQAALDALRATMPRNPESNATIATCIEQWRTYTLVRPHTKVNQDGLVRKWIEPHLGSRRARDLTPLDVEAFAHELARLKASPSTVRNVLSILSAVFEVAVRHQWVDDNPVRKALKPARPRKRRPLLGVDQVRALMAAAAERGPVEAVWFRLYVITGGRRSEVLALRWTDLDGPLLTIERTLIPVRGGWTETTTKAGDVRTIPLDPVTASMVLALRGHLEGEARRAGVELAPDAFLLPTTPDGSQPIHPKRASDLFLELAAKVGVSGFHLHDVRHFAGTHVVAELDAPTGSLLLGHARTAMTLDVYSHAVDGRMVAATELMASKLDGP